MNSCNALTSALFLLTLVVCCLGIPLLLATIMNKAVAIPKLYSQYTEPQKFKKRIKILYLCEKHIKGMKPKAAIVVDTNECAQCFLEKL